MKGIMQSVLLFSDKDVAKLQSKINAWLNENPSFVVEIATTCMLAIKTSTGVHSTQVETMLYTTTIVLKK